MNAMTVKEVRRILTDWDLNVSVKDPEVLADIEDAIMEAYIIGAQHGGMDTSIFEDALAFDFQKH